MCINTMNVKTVVMHDDDDDDDDEIFVSFILVWTTATHCYVSIDENRKKHFPKEPLGLSYLHRSILAKRHI